MHYHEDLPDGTCLGLFDGTKPPSAIAEAGFYWYHEAIARREDPRTHGHAILGLTQPHPLHAIQHARVRTAGISSYRIQRSTALSFGQDFPKMWKPTASKRDRGERFSPPGTVGYYFGLSVDAAVDEASHYLGRNIELESDPSLMILVHRTYFTDLLYLAPVLPAVWEHLNLPTMSSADMYLAVMSPSTSSTSFRC
jgi:hypothetical protein